MTIPSGSSSQDNPGLLRLPDDPSPRRFARILFGPGGIRAGWRLLFFLAIMIVSLLALQMLVPAPPALLPLPQHPVFPVSVLLTQEILLAISALVAAGVMVRIEGRSLADYGFPLRKAFGRRFWQGVLWGLIAITAMILLIRAGGGYSFGGLALSGRTLVAYALLWAVVFLLVGFSEEFIFRGYAQFTLAEGMRFWPAAVALSAGFGSVHLTNPGEGWVGALSIFVIGMFFCLTLRRTGDIWFAIGMHASFDYGETFLFAVPNSGIRASGQLLQSSFHGPRWLTGGSIGPEGSVISFVVMAALFIAFALIYRPRAGTSDRSSAV